MFVITGGSRGLGEALARVLVEAGESVLIVGRHSATLQAVSKRLGVSFITADVSTVEGRDTIVKGLSGLSTLKGLIHNAGVIKPIKPLMQLTLSDYQHVMATHVEAPLFLTQALAPQLVSGRVLMVGTAAAYEPIQAWSLYCVSKAALSMLTRCWQLECPDLCCASVMPGIIDTDMQAEIRASSSMSPSKHDFFMQLKASSQLLTPMEVANYLKYLLLEVDRASFACREWDIYETMPAPWAS